MSTKVLEVNNINKKFKTVHAVKDVSFSVEKGEIFAFLGPNGAGKTTTLRIMMDIIHADSGSVRWNLHNNSENIPLPSMLGYLPEERGLYLDLPVIKTLVYLAKIRGMKGFDAKQEAMKWMERLDIADRAKEKLQALSKGNQQKVQFISAILHKPKFAVLDEPFSGFDPVNQEMFIDIIQDLKKQGTTILLSAHQMQLVERVADRIFLINQGREIFYGKLSDIYNQHGNQYTIQLTFNNGEIPHIPQNISDAENIIKESNDRLKIIFRKDISLQKIMTTLSGIDGIMNIKTHNSNLHDIFLNLVKREKPTQTDLL